MLRAEFLLLTLALTFRVAEAAPLEAYGRLPLYENVAISPDGKRVAFVTTVGDQREIVVQPLTTLTEGEGILRIKAGDKKLRDLDWATGEQLLITISQSTDFMAGSQGEQFALSNYDFRRKSVFSPMLWTTETWDILAANPITRVVDGKPMVFVHNFTKPRRGDRFAIPALYRADLKEQTTVLIDGAPVSDARKSYSWAVDGRGKVVLQSLYDEETKSWSLSIKQGEAWKEAQVIKALIDTPSIVGFGPEPDVVTLKQKVGDKWILKRVSIKDGSWGPDLPDEKCCATQYLHDPLNYRIIGYSWQDARRHYTFFDSKLQQAWEQVVQSFPGEELKLESWSNDLSKMVVRVFGQRSGAAYVLVDAANKQLSRVGNLYAGIEAVDIAQVKPISYVASDGMQISGYLTLPNGKAAKDLPLIVLPHGGPASRDVLGFDWIAQALASRGYLVLQPNFRGSWGLGVKVEEAGYGEYGRKMQTDLSDGVRALTKLGIADAKRVCIVGASYGGYAALNGATTEPDTYRCAASVAGVADLKEQTKKYVNESVSEESRSLRYMLRYFGAKDLSDPVVAERSPALHADKISIPVLLVHGDNDSVVDFKQSQLMADALKKAGKPFEFVKMKSEDHWLSKAETRQQMLQSVVKFLEANNPP